MECCSGYSCIIGDPSKVSVSKQRSNTYYGKQSHVFFKTGISFGLPLKVKTMNLKEKSVFCSYNPNYDTAMAQQQNPSSSNSKKVIGSKYSIYPLDLAMVKKITNCDYAVSHRVDPINFSVTREFNSFHQDFVLCDYADEPLVTIRKKIFTTQERWQVYRGLNTDDKNLLFSAKKSSMKHSNKVNVNIYLSSNIIEDECDDFKIAENWLSKNTCDVYMGDNIIAQIQKNENRLFENDKLKLYVYPYVDYAFIVALSVIVNEMDCLEDGKTLPSILASHIFQHKITFMALLLGGVFIVSAKFLAPLISKAMPIILDIGGVLVVPAKFLAPLISKAMPIILEIGTIIVYAIGTLLVLLFYACAYVLILHFSDLAMKIAIKVRKFIEDRSGNLFQ